MVPCTRTLRARENRPIAASETAVADIFSSPFAAGRWAVALALAGAVAVLAAELFVPALPQAPAVSAIIAAPAARRKAAWFISSPLMAPSPAAAPVTASAAATQRSPHRQRPRAVGI